MRIAISTRSTFRATAVASETGPQRTRTTTALVLLVVAGLAAACQTVGVAPDSVTTEASVGGTSPRYVALGDSYTIGTSVDPAERWPNQLVDRLPAGGLELIANLGVNGYTSGDLIADELPQLDELEPEFVTVLIGVNDVVQGVPEERFSTNLATILDDLLGRLPAERIVAVSTPDYTATPQGAAFGDPNQQGAAIRRFNALLADAVAARGIRFVDIYDISLEAETNRSLVAGDGLHPSGAQYARWVDRIAPVVEELLGR